MDSYVGEIRMFTGEYAPEGWALCNGSLLPIRENEALFSLLGNVWGGDGRTTFAVPDLRGRIPVGQGQSQVPGGSLYNVGQTGGVEQVTLQSPQIPAHTHNFNVASAAANQVVPSVNTILGCPVDGDVMYLPDTVPSPTAASPGDNTLLPAGGGQPHDNMMPGFPLTFIICTIGTYPTRS